MNMGEKIRYLREQRDMTLEELGDKVGVGKSTVRKWENGIIANMRRDKISKLAEALGVSPGYLMGWEGEDPEPEPDERAKEFIELFTHASPDVREAVVTLLKSSRPAP